MKNNALMDKDFLRKLDIENQKEIFAKIISLTLDELPVEQIEGKVTGGSINIDGSSAVRRSCSLTLVAENVDINDFYWGLSSKFKLYIGLKNTIDKNYPDIIWFPQGVFLITSFNTSYTTKSFQISISGKDKMCLLNGDIGGNFPNVIDFSVEQVENEIGAIVKEKRNIKYIIREMIHYYGNEPFHNIYINDVDDKGLELLEYRGKNDLYILVNDNNEYVNILFDGDVIRYKENGQEILIKDIPENQYFSLAPGADNLGALKIKESQSISDRTYFKVAKCSYGESFGYRMTDLTWPDKEGLIANVGDTITSILDKICSTFGDYEYFYDVDGHFVFQKKLTYLNTSWSNIVSTTDITTKDLIQDYNLEKYKDYYIDENDNEVLTEAGKNKLSIYEKEVYIESSKTVSQYSYNFSDSILISSFQNTPNLNNLKNDYTIWGKKPAVAENSEGKDIHLRYAIHEKPSSYRAIDGRLYLTTDIIAQNYIKEKPPEGLNDDWWDLKDWAELYKLYFGDYPSEHMDMYCTNDGDYLDLNTIFGFTEDLSYFKSIYGVEVDKVEPYYGAWIDNYSTGGVSVFDLLPDGHLGYCGHGNSCSHPYEWFLSKYEKFPGYKAYIYSPEVPGKMRNGSIGVDWRELIYQMALDYLAHGHDENFAHQLAVNNPEYPTGKTGYEQYYTDMLAFWRDIYDPNSDNKEEYHFDNIGLLGWRKQYVQNPSLLDFWIDFLDSKGTGLSKYSVKAIGDRSKIINDTSIKAIIYSEVPTLIYISKEKYEQLKAQGQLNTGYSYIIIPDNYKEFFTVSTQRKTTYTELDNALYNFAYCNESITIKSIPIYYLSPNTKISVNDNESNIHGEYIINKISLQLGHNGMMTIQASKVPIRLN